MLSIGCISLYGNSRSSQQLQAYPLQEIYSSYPGCTMTTGKLEDNKENTSGMIARGDSYMYGCLIHYFLSYDPRLGVKIGNNQTDILGSKNRLFYKAPPTGVVPYGMASNYSLTPLDRKKCHHHDAHEFFLGWGNIIVWMQWDTFQYTISTRQQTSKPGFVSMVPQSGTLVSHH